MRWYTGLMLTVTLAMSLTAKTQEHHPEQSHRDYQYWFADNRLSNSGIAVTSLLADLGYRTSPQLSQNEKRDLFLTARQITHDLLGINSLAINHQVSQSRLSLTAIDQAFKQNRLRALIDSQLPRLEQVTLLRSAISHMRQSSYQDWPQLADDFSPRLGQRHPEVHKLIAMLTALGDLPATYHTPHAGFTPTVQDALKQFQRRHQLPPSGKLTAATRDRLTRSPGQRLQVLQLNLRRWLSLPAVPPSQYIVVNIPSYSLAYFHENRQQFSMPVIVGHPNTPTPIMLTEISSITANPVWRPPRSIIENQLLDLLNRYPLRLSAQQFYWRSRTQHDQIIPITQVADSPRQQLTNYRLEQGPGEHNALGRWRFNIKNNDAIYLHDTPVKQLFNQPYRALSHGCIRLADAAKLAAYLLADFVPMERTQTRRLPQGVPTYINYQTVQIHHHTLFWFDDIYHLDAAQLENTFSQLSAKDRI